MLKRITDPNTGRDIVFGRKPPKAQCPHFKLKNYLKASILAPPLHYNYSPKAMSALSLIYMNSSLGCCVISGGEHEVGVFTGNATGTPFKFTDEQTIALYSAIGGYVPGDPSTDQGCDEQTALNYFQTKGFLPDGSHKIAAWVKVDATNVVECRTALWLFENLYFGVELPDLWVNPFPGGNGFIWDVAGDADPQNGHCFVATSYDQTGFLIDTWGLLGVITPAAVSKYAGPSSNGELYTLLSQDSINAASKKCPNGFNFAQLTADIAAMAA